MTTIADARAPSAPPRESARAPSFFFIVGCPRSGTTLLRWMLDSHPDIAVTPETHFGQRYLPLDRARRDDAGHTSVAEVWTSGGALDRFCASRTFKELAIDEGAFRERAGLLSGKPWGPLRVAMEDFARLRNASIVGEKTPSHALDLDALAEAFPGSCFLILTRDPRAVAASWHRASWSQHSTMQIADTWCRYVRAQRRALKRVGSRCLEITYEDLVQQPRPVLGRICEFLGTDFDAQMLRYHERPENTLSSEERRDHALTFSLPEPSRIAAWRLDLPKNDLRQVEAICARLMVQCGYPLRTSMHERFPGMLRSLPRSWQKRIKRRLRRRA